MANTLRLKRGNKAALPLNALSGEPLITLDTRELFIGDAGGVVQPVRVDASNILNAGTAGTLATLGADGKIPASQIPALAIGETYVVASEAAMLALACQQGDVAVRTDIFRSFILAGSAPSVLANWQELLSPTSPVQSVNGLVGAVLLTTTEIPEGANLYHTEARVDARIALATLDGGTF